MAHELPSYIVPSAILPLEHTPLNSSGKVDRKALRKLTSDTPQDKLLGIDIRSSKKVLPATPMEEKILLLWSKVLALAEDNFSVVDSFYSLGESSLTAIKLLSEARKSGISFESSLVFENPNMRELNFVARFFEGEFSYDTAKATELERLLKVEAGDALYQFDALGVAEVAKATDMQANFLYTALLEIRGMSYCIYFDFTGPMGIPRLQQSCNACWKIYLLSEPFISFGIDKPFKSNLRITHLNSSSTTYHQHQIFLNSPIRY